ncbi:MAG: NAD-dependent epimerase/dehydratase family protein [Bacilli bacterium]|nr:NAD-dependent epimerase/dehydratase family protein [Bacilli bacterium]
MTTYYITGIAGHLGRNVLLELNNIPNVNVVGLVLPNDNIQDLNSIHDLRLVEGNVLDKTSIKIFLETNKAEHNIVIHCAGLISIYKHNDDRVMNVNVNGTKNLLEEALNSGIERFIYVSSVDGIKKNKKGMPNTETDSYDPKDVIGVYGQSKARASSLVKSYNSEKMQTISIHPSAILGPNDYYGGPINTVMKKFLNGKLPTIVTGGYDLVDVRDVANGIVMSSIVKNPKISYILSGHPIEIRKLIDLASDISGLPSYKHCFPATLIKVVAPFMELHSKIHKTKPLFTAYSMTCLHMNYLYDHSRATKDLNYKPRELKETISDTFKWIQK